jgi:hypothetical protein
MFSIINAGYCIADTFHDIALKQIIYDNHITSELFVDFFCFIFVVTMKRTIIIFSICLLALAGCTKVEPTRTAGTDTIDNITYTGTTYFVYGFSFSTAKLVSTESNPGPDIVLYINKENTPYRLTFQADNLKPSFYKVGDFADADAAKDAFDNLKTVSVTQWEEMADPITDNQVWIYRSGEETFTKIRIISTVNEIRQLIAYGECTFQWTHQPDGSLTFP